MILLEDFAALIGLVLALLGVGLTCSPATATSTSPAPPASACCWSRSRSCSRIETKSLLLGEAASPEAQRRLRGSAAGRRRASSG